MDQLQKKYKHLSSLPILPVKDAQPILLIGSDQPHLITPIRLGSPDGPAALQTRLGGTLLTSILSPQDELFKNVQILWQVEDVPHWDENEVTR